MSSASIKKIQNVVTTLKSFTNQLNKAERAPRMIKLSEASKSTGSSWPLGTLFNKIASFNPVSAFVSLPDRVAWNVSELELAFGVWLKEWKQLAIATPFNSFSRPVSFFGDYITPLDSLTFVYQQLIDLLFAYQCYLKYVEALTLNLLPLVSELFQTYSLKATSLHWFYLPTVKIKKVELPNDLDTLKYQRHPIDDRYDFRDLHKRGRPNEYAMWLMKKFSEIENSKLNCEFYGSCLTATYPMVPRSHCMTQSPRNVTEGSTSVQSSPKEEELFLLNDPNNDGYLCILGDGWMVGATTDGSGAGAHARHASNLLLASLFQMIVGDVLQEDLDETPDSLGFTKFCLKQTPWKTSHDCLQFLERSCREAQKVIVDADEAGATTVIMFTITQMTEDDASIYRINSPSFATKFKNDEDPVFVLNYLIAGDAEGFVFDSISEEWQGLSQPPHIHDGIRLHTSLTPGGIGRHHGDRDLIYGVYGWPEYLTRNDDYDRSKWVNFHAHPNNLHFGQCFICQDDFFIATTDGFGDTIDPIQLYPKPNLIIGLEAFESWQRFIKEYPQPKFVMRRLREMIMKSILGSTVNPYYDSQEQKPMAEAILQACVKHAMAATLEERNLYSDSKFRDANKFDKQAIMEKKVLEWIEKNWPRRLTAGSPSTSVPYAIPSTIVPFAKFDHLGIQVVQPKLLLLKK